MNLIPVEKGGGGQRANRAAGTEIMRRHVRHINHLPSAVSQGINLLFFNRNSPSELAKPGQRFYSCFCQLRSSGDDNSVSSVCPDLVVCRYVGQWAGLTGRGLTAPVTADADRGGGGDRAKTKIRGSQRCKEPNQKSC